MNTTVSTNTLVYPKTHSQAIFQRMTKIFDKQVNHYKLRISNPLLIQSAEKSYKTKVESVQLEKTLECIWLKDFFLSPPQKIVGLKTLWNVLFMLIKVTYRIWDPQDLSFMQKSLWWVVGGGWVVQTHFSVKLEPQAEQFLFRAKRFI